MEYKKIVKGTFISRPNRFVAYVLVDGAEEKVHVKNTGRCRELLIPGAEVILSEAENAERKTKYDLIAVYKQGLGLVNIDSQAPNKVVGEWLAKMGMDVVNPEFTYGASRLDFFVQKDSRKMLMEVKGCTLEVDGVGYFPDAPTERGTKHIKELEKAVKEGYEAYLVFVIQMPKVKKVKPNAATDPKFAAALEQAEKAGVKVLYLRCKVEENTIVAVKNKCKE